MNQAYKTDWHALENFVDLQRQMDAFLQGQVDYTLWHNAELDFESSLIHNELLALNNKGVVPIGSQPGMNSWRGYKQKAYLEALVEPETISKLEKLKNLYDLSFTKNCDSSLKDAYSIPVSRGFFRHQTFQPGPSGPMSAMAFFDENNLFTDSSKAFYDSLYTVSIVEKTWGTNLLWEDVLAVV